MTTEVSLTAHFSGFGKSLTIFGPEDRGLVERVWVTLVESSLVGSVRDCDVLVEEDGFLVDRELMGALGMTELVMRAVMITMRGRTGWR